ncbi:hypothetical protein ACRAWD_23140 [Caulobacter segnis]
MHMSYDSVARTLLAIERMGVPNVGILLDFGHLAVRRGVAGRRRSAGRSTIGRLFGMDVNDNMRGWDDDLIAGSVHPIELFEFFGPCARTAGRRLATGPVPVPRGHAWPPPTAPSKASSSASEAALDRLDVEGLKGRPRRRQDAVAAPGYPPHGPVAAPPWVFSRPVV